MIRAPRLKHRVAIESSTSATHSFPSGSSPYDILTSDLPVNVNYSGVEYQIAVTEGSVGSMIEIPQIILEQRMAASWTCLGV